MRFRTKNKGKKKWLYVAKIAIATFLFYSTADLAGNLGFIEIFNHENYTVFWPPSGIALGLMLTWGRSMWPGILIGSLLRMPFENWLQLSQTEINEIIITTVFFSIGRILEPFIGYTLLKKMGIHRNPFKTNRNVFYFIIVVILISSVSSVMGMMGIDLTIEESTEVLLMRIFGWYINSVIGILVFTPLVYSLLSQLRPKNLPKQSSLLAIIALTIGSYVLIYHLKDGVRSINMIIENALPFLIIPVLLWVAFSYSFLTSSYAIFLTSVILIYFTYLGYGPFVTRPSNVQHTVWLLQSFLFILSSTALVAHAVSLEIKENILQRSRQNIDLQRSQEVLLQTMEDLSKARNKAQESDRLKSSFLANMSLEIRTPMNAIMGISELLDRFDLPDDKRRELTYLMNDQSENLLSIINNILLISQLEINQKKPIWINTDLNMLFEDLTETYSEKVRQKKENVMVQADIKLEGDDRTILADPLNLKIVLTNLLDNAFKFTRQGYIRLSCIQQDRNTLLFSVSDTGVGIPADKFNLIFQPFSRAGENAQLKHGGTGLGLAICKILVYNWGGRIWLESTKGNGSIFFFTIPYKRNPE